MLESPSNIADVAQKAFICGLCSVEVSAEELAFLSAARPAGIILFARNIDNPAQVRKLIGQAKAAIGREHTLIMIDQEGGRVQRLRPPHWRTYPAASRFADIHDIDAKTGAALAGLASRLLGKDLHGLGINANCAPVLDCPVPGADGIIGDRAYGCDTQSIIALGRAVADGFLAAGVLPIVKHIPGHGRATADSHLALPVVDTDRETLVATDFKPFAELAGLPMAMTAHVVYSAIDPAEPATTSKRVISEVIRGVIGFDGLLMSDDLSMQALSGSLGSRIKAAIDAGCDVVLHCNGKIDEMREVADASPELTGTARQRFDAAFGRLTPPKPFDEAEAEAAVAAALAGTA